MRPLSLGHVLILRHLGNSFVTECPQVADLPVAAFVCAHGWRENVRKLRKPGTVAKLFRLWGFLTRRVDKAAEAKALHAHIAEAMELPEMKRERGGGVRYLVSEWETRLFMHLREMGYSDDEALDLPLARALTGVLEVVHIDRRARLLDQPEQLLALARCDVLVLPRTTLDAGALALLRCPVLLVG